MSIAWRRCLKTILQLQHNHWWLGWSAGQELGPELPLGQVVINVKIAELRIYVGFYGLQQVYRSEEKVIGLPGFVEVVPEDPQPISTNNNAGKFVGLASQFQVVGRFEPLVIALVEIQHRYHAGKALKTSGTFHQRSLYT